MAGSALLGVSHRAPELDTVTLTVNNSCNLHCPHCYLQYEGEGTPVLDWRFAEHVLQAHFRHLAIVGKEPLADRRSALLTAHLIDTIVASDRSCSVVTNGLNLNLWNGETFRRLSWLDVSLDGGPDTYRGYRGGSYARLMRGIAHARQCGLEDLRILHTISSGNLDATAEAITAALSFGPRYVVVSPYLATRQHGVQHVAMVAPDVLLRVLEDSGAHRDDRVWLALDCLYLSHFDPSDTVGRAAEMFGDRLSYVDTDPLDRGLIRVTYDGLVLSPAESAHVADYRRLGRPLLQRPLNAWYGAMLAEQPAGARWH